jgi:hypothetical protein
MPFDTLHIAHATCSPARCPPPARTTRNTPRRIERCAVRACTRSSRPGVQRCPALAYALRGPVGRLRSTARAGQVAVCPAARDVLPVCMCRTRRRASRCERRITPVLPPTAVAGSAGIRPMKPHDFRPCFQDSISSLSASPLFFSFPFGLCFFCLIQPPCSLTLLHSCNIFHARPRRSFSYVAMAHGYYWFSGIRSICHESTPLLL